LAGIVDRHYQQQQQAPAERERERERASEPICDWMDALCRISLKASAIGKRMGRRRRFRVTNISTFTHLKMPQLILIGWLAGAQTHNMMSYELLASEQQFCSSMQMCAPDQEQHRRDTG
jgi:hypothetical protein